MSVGSHIIFFLEENGIFFIRTQDFEVLKLKNILTIKTPICYSNIDQCYTNHSNQQRKENSLIAFSY